MTNADKKTIKIQDIHRRKYLASVHLLPEGNQKRLKGYFQVIFTFLALIFAVIFAIEPTLTTITELNRQLLDSKNVSNALQTKISRLSQLNLQYSTLQPVLRNVFSAIPKTEDAQLLLAEIQSLAQQHSLSVNALNAQADSTQTNPLGQDILLTIDLNGSYPDIRAFLEESTQFQRIILPTSITLSKSVGSDSISLIMNGKAYFTP